MANPGYYEALTKSKIFYPNPSFQQIELDLKRTYPQQRDKDKMERDIIVLRRFLYAYVLRNPTIGYCQGMNNIASKLLSTMPEEDAFWTFCSAIENILPLDYYSNMLGVLIEQQVLEQLMSNRFKALIQHL